MDLGKWFSVLKSIPKEKLQSESGLKEVFRDMGKKAGKNFSDQELNSFVSKFRQMSKTEDMSSLMQKLGKKGVDQEEINQLKKRFKK